MAKEFKIKIPEKGDIGIFLKKAFFCFGKNLIIARKNILLSLRKSKNDLLENKTLSFFLFISFFLLLPFVGFLKSLLLIFFTASLFFSWSEKSIVFAGFFLLLLYPFVFLFWEKSFSEELALWIFAIFSLSIVTKVFNYLFLRKKYPIPDFQKKEIVQEKRQTISSWQVYFQKTKNLFSKMDPSIYLFSFLTVVILWQMLLPGYVLTLDMYFAPDMKIFLSEKSSLNDLPILLLIKVLSLVFPTWFIQKIILFLIIFLIGYIAFRFLPFRKDNNMIRYAGSVFYLFNPFVYTRFLAGHWLFLFGYAFLPAFLGKVFDFRKSHKLTDFSWVLFWLFLIGSFSLHLFVASALILFFILFSSFLNDLKKRKIDLKFWGGILNRGIVLLATISYWLIPFLLEKKRSVLNTFGENNWEAFATSADSRWGTLVNVLSLYGFWNETHPWSQYFVWPKENDIFFWIVFLSIIFVISLGIWKTFSKKDKNIFSVFYVSIAFLALIFSSGMGETIFRGFNNLLFENIFFWRGFRETQKWSAFLVLIYSIWFGFGFGCFLSFWKKYEWRKKIWEFWAVLIIFLPIIFVYPMSFGFQGQIKSIWYPEDWQKAADFLEEDGSDYRAVFLPWHQYFSLHFNQNLISMNPARHFLDRNKVFFSQDMELLDVKSFSRGGPEGYQKIDRIVRWGDIISQKDIFNALKSQNVKYIILTNDIRESDKYQYTFLEYVKFKAVLKEKSLTIFELEL